MPYDSLSWRRNRCHVGEEGASLEVDHFQDLFLGYDPPSKEMPFVGAYFRKSPIHKEVHILTLVLSEGQELNMTPTPCPRRNRSIVSVSSWKGFNCLCSRISSWRLLDAGKRVESRVRSIVGFLQFLILEST